MLARTCLVNDICFAPCQSTGSRRVLPAPPHPLPRTIHCSFLLAAAYEQLESRTVMGKLLLVTERH